MFEAPSQPKRKTRISLLASFLVHCILVFLWLSRPPIFVQPSAVAWGQQGNSQNLVYLPRTLEAPPKDSPRKIHYHVKKPDAARQPAQNTVESARAGLSNGSLYSGPASGTEATPALPMVFPDPEIYPWQLKGLQGDVIVEVTIDEKGNVTETRVLQSLQQEIDDRVIATLRNWRFKPASVDGIAISSRQDVHFHFPS